MIRQPTLQRIEKGLLVPPEVERRKNASRRHGIKRRERIIGTIRRTARQRMRTRHANATGRERRHITFACFTRCWAARGGLVAGLCSRKFRPDFAQGTPSRTSLREVPSGLRSGKLRLDFAPRSSVGTFAAHVPRERPPRMSLQAVRTVRTACSVRPVRPVRPVRTERMERTVRSRGLAFALVTRAS